MSARVQLGAGSFRIGDQIEDGSPQTPSLLNSPSFRASDVIVTTSWASKTFMSGCAILLPVFITLTVTSWLIEAVDGIFSPVFKEVFGFQIFGLGFLTALAIIFIAGMAAQSWIGNIFVRISEMILFKVPFVTQIYSAAKQIGQAIDPTTETSAFKSCVLIRHPRHGEYALAFVTGETTLQDEGALLIVYVPTNHAYVGDIYMLSPQDVIKTNLTVGEGLEVVVSMGMCMPSHLYRQSKQ